MFFGSKDFASARLRFLPDEAVAALSALRIRPKITVDGRVSGIHRSRHVGRSLEFAELKPYAFGDDKKSVDWKVYARLDRLYSRQFVDETNMAAYLLLDASGSMAYPQGASKYEYAAAIITAFAFALLRQSDEVGFCVAKGTKPRFYPPRGNPALLQEMIAFFAETRPSGPTVLEKALETILGLRVKRGLVVLASDLLTNLEPVLAALRALAARGHCVVVFHVLSPEERGFPFHGPVVFSSNETGETVLLDASGLRPHYMKAMNNFVSCIRSNLLEAKAFYVPVSMERPAYVEVIEAVDRISSETRG